MKTTIETISGKLCTVIRRDFDAEKVRESLAMGVPVVAETKAKNRYLLKCFAGGEYASSMQNKVVGGFCIDGVSMSEPHFAHTITLLPALPRHPKPEDAALLYRYLAEGLHVIAHRLDNIERSKLVSTHRIEDVLWGWWKAHPPLAEYRITHCVDTHGNRVDVAIEGVA